MNNSKDWERKCTICGCKHPINTDMCISNLCEDKENLQDDINKLKQENKELYYNNKKLQEQIDLLTYEVLRLRTKT